MKFIVGFLLLSIYSVQGQTIKGTITTVEGSGIPDVHITVMNTHLGTSTDRAGNFKLNRIPTGSTLRMSAIGYVTKDIAVVDTIVLATLEPAIIYLNNNIVITAQRFEANQFDVSESITVVNHTDILQNVPRSTPEALFGSTGIWVQKTNHGGGSPIIRGLVGNQILLMIDGIRLNNATYRYGPNQYLSTVDPALIEKIEATRGNGSVLYGSDALGGVVNVFSITPFFNQDKKFTGTLNGKWVNEKLEKSGRGEVQFSSKNIASMIGLSARDFGDIVAGGGLGVLAPTGYSEISSDMKLVIRASERNQFTGAYQHHTQNTVPRYDQVTQGGYKVYNFSPQTRQLGYVRWETFSDNKILQSFRLTASLNRTTEGIDSQKDGSSNLKNQLDIVDTHGYVAEFTSQWKPYWHSQTGFEYYHDAVASNARVTDRTTEIVTKQRGSFADGSTSNSMAFFSNHVRDWKKIQLTAGMRFNVLSVSIQDTTFGDQQIKTSAWVGNIGLSYTVDSEFHLIASINSGFRSPNIDDMSKFGAVESTVFEIPSVNLSPERSFSIETGLKTRGDKFSGSFVVYKTFLFDLIDRVPVTYQGQDTIDTRKVYQKQNIGKSELYGFETDVEFKVISSFVAIANITYTYGQNLSKDEPMRRIPPVFGKVGARYQKGEHWWAKTEWIFAGRQDRLAGGDLGDGRIAIRLENGVMPGWNVLNLSAGVKIKFINITASVQNIFDAAYRVYGSGVDGYGRNFSIASSIHF